MLELIGTEEDGTYRFPLTLDDLDVESLLNNNMIKEDKYYDGLIIPIKCTDNNCDMYDEMCEYLSGQVNQRLGNVDPYAEQTLDLILSDNQNNNLRSFYIGSSIKLIHWRDISTYEMIKIHPDVTEINLINKILLKFTNSNSKLYDID